MTVLSDAQEALASAVVYKAVLVGDDASSLVFNDVERQVAIIRADLDEAVVNLRKTYGVSAAEACRHLVLAGDTLQVLAEKVAESLRRIVPHTLEQPTSCGRIAFDLYEDITRAPELITLNPDVISHPNFLPAGLELQVYDR